MRQLAILYRDAGNLLKSNIDQWRQDKVAQVIHWNLCGKLGNERDENYCNHEPKPVYESTNNKLLWDFKIQTDNKIEHDKPGIEVLDKMERQMSDYRCCLSVWHPSERQMEREN